MSAKHVKSDSLGTDNVGGTLQELFSAMHACIIQQQTGRTNSNAAESPAWSTLVEIHQNICSPAVTTLRAEHLSCVVFDSVSKVSFSSKKKCRTFHSQLPPNSSLYKYRRSDPPQHSVCCPLNRTFIMKTVILAILLFLVVASIVSGAPEESGKSRCGNETCLVVVLQTLKY